MLNMVAIQGRLVRDPEMRTTSNGISVASFTIASERNYARNGEERQADFIDVVAWRQTAEFVCKYFQKGSMIIAEGQLQSRRYQDKNGNDRTAIEIVASKVNFDGPKNNGQQTAQTFERAQANPASVMPQAPSNEAEPDGFALLDSEDDLPF